MATTVLVTRVAARALFAAVPRPIVVFPVVVALAVGLILPVVIGRQVGQSEPVVRGYEVDARRRGTPVGVVDVPRSRSAVGRGSTSRAKMNPWAGGNPRLTTDCLLFIRLVR